MLWAKFANMEVNLSMNFFSSDGDFDWLILIFLVFILGVLSAQLCKSSGKDMKFPEFCDKDIIKIMQIYKF